jgi:hypothetical protein
MSGDTDMKTPEWFDGKINLGNVVSWCLILTGLVASFTWVQADVRELRSFKEEAKTEIRDMKMNRQNDRDALMEIRGDIRVIRQMIEQQSRQSPTPR